MKKVLLIALCVVLIFSFTSCSCGNETNKYGSQDSKDSDFVDISAKTGTTDSSGKSKLVLKNISSQCRTYEIYIFEGGKAVKQNEYLQLTTEALYERMKSYIDLANKKTATEKTIIYDDKPTFTIGTSYKSLGEWAGKSFDEIKDYFTSDKSEKLFEVV